MKLAPVVGLLVVVLTFYLAYKFTLTVDFHADKDSGKYVYVYLFAGLVAYLAYEISTYLFGKLPFKRVMRRRDEREEAWKDAVQRRMSEPEAPVAHDQAAFEDVQERRVQAPAFAARRADLTFCEEEGCNNAGKLCLVCGHQFCAIHTDDPRPPYHRHLGSP